MMTSTSQEVLQGLNKLTGKPLRKCLAQDSKKQNCFMWYRIRNMLQGLDHTTFVGADNVG